MQYEEQAPRPEFAALVSRFWAFETAAEDPLQVDHVVMPDGACNLTLVEPGPQGRLYASLSGPSAVAMRVPIYRGVRYRGVRLQPGALRAFLGIDVALIVGRNLPLETVMPECYASLCVCLSPLPQSLAAFSSGIERVFADHVDHARLLDDAVQNVVSLLIQTEGNESLSVLLESSGLSERQLRRRFVAEVGVTPKVFSRLRRVRRACIDLLQNKRLGVAAIASEHGFADQAHFSHELRAIFGMSPQLLHQYLSQIQHTNVSGLNGEN